MGENPTFTPAFSHFGVRQSSAAGVLGECRDQPANPKSRLFPWQSAALSGDAIKAAPILGNIPQERGSHSQPWRRPKR
jgi:hypothetical protein